jgi:16S rRNA (cytidine1402-2'-O)-methyltransferase
MEEGKGKLYLVPTPIGNLEDITLRAINVLKSVDLILAEDTRTSSVLLKKYGITTHMESHHKFNEHKTVGGVCEKILDGQTVALISDAGLAWNFRPRIFACQKLH